MNRTATLLSLTTIILWALLPVFSARLEHLHPFLLIGLTLTTAGLVGLLRWRAWRVPWYTFAIGVVGIFGNLFFYYSSLQNAPVIAANLLSYTYPVFMVLLSPLVLAGYRVRPHHLAGALLGLAGVSLIVSGGSFELGIGSLSTVGSLSIAGAPAGYIYGLAASLSWAVYSLATRRLPAFPSGAVGGFCLASGLLALAVVALGPGLGHSLSGVRSADWPLLLAIGIGPSGAAYFTWDAALKRGDPRVIGVLTYLAPLLSALLLAALGQDRLSPLSLLAMALIVAGAVLSSLESMRPAKAPGRSGASLS
jgi:drug/metabolite transporter (DMT)-like permease